MSTAFLPRGAQVVEVKRGDSLILGCTAMDSSGVVVPLTGITVEAQMRDGAGALVVALEYQAVNEAAGVYELWHPGDSLVTAAPGDYIIDIQYKAVDGERTIVRSTRSFYIRVLAEVTA